MTDWIGDLPTDPAEALRLAEKLSPADRERLMQAAHEAIVARAREDSAVFAAHILRDEGTGLPIRLAPVHRQWHGLMSKHDRLVLLSHVELGKTQHIAIARVLFELGRNPNLRVVVLSDTATQAEKIVRVLGSHIERNPAVRQVFPGIEKTPNAQEPWSTTAIAVKRATIAKDPSVAAYGVHGALTGSRVDLLIVDDILDRENTLTSHRRKDVIGWFESTVLSRLAPDARVIAIGNAWHPADLMHHLGLSPLYVTRKFPVYDDAGSVTWPERWPRERIEQRRMELGEAEFGRQMLCIARDDCDQRIKPEWIKNGTPPEVLAVVIGVDLAISEAAHSDYTAAVALGLDLEGDVWILGADRLRGGVDSVAALLARMAATWRTDRVAVEDASVQRATIQELARRLPRLSVIPMLVGTKNKIDRFAKLESRYSLGLVRHGPGVPQWWVDELLSFPGGGDHDDGVDAAAHAYNAAVMPDRNENFYQDDFERSYCERLRRQQAAPWYAR